MKLNNPVSVAELIGSGALSVGDGYRTKRAELSSSGYRIVRVADISDGMINLGGVDCVSEEFGSEIGGKAGKAGDVLLTTKGTVGRVAIVQELRERIVYSPQVCYFRVHDHEVIISRFLAFWFASPEFLHQASHRMNNTDMAAYINLGDIRSLEISLPSLEVQSGIAEVLGALDDKIAANVKLVGTSAQLAMALLAKATESDAVRRPIADVTTLLARGVTPSYTESEEDSMVILNQKCVRGQRVSLGPSRRTGLNKVRSEKILMGGDVLVNSTGQGTLGRVARWTWMDEATVDSHITIVRFDSNQVDPACAGYAMLGLQSTIEELGEGSTGQTELSRVELGRLNLVLPSREASHRLGARLTTMAEMEDSLLREADLLAALRDTLLPELISGRLRVKDAEKKIEEVV